ncbi:MAG TPA: aldo/keto reductase [Xanthobacteraceae bacterium]|nr:aldo/keto reductase [Xanthobacteraceae bacterium]
MARISAASHCSRLGFLVANTLPATLNFPCSWQSKPSAPGPFQAAASGCRRWGLGTAYVFDRNDETTRQKAAAVVQALVGGGGSLIDTSSAYGDAEAVLGEVIAAAALRDKLFIATKLESPDAAELKRSQARLKTEKLDLLQLHNVRNPQQSLAQLRKWKEQGVCRYIGITSTRHGILPPSKRYCSVRNRISCKSIIRSMTAKRKNASCRSPSR